MESEEITLRQMLREHINDSRQFQIETVKSLVKIEVNGEHSKKQAEDHEKKINHLVNSNNKQRGALWAATVFGFMSLVKIIKDIWPS